MPRFGGMASQPFFPEILDVTLSHHVQTPQINYYRGECNPVEHIQRHEASLLGRMNDDKQFPLLFHATLEGLTSHLFFRLPKMPVRSWGDLKEKFIVPYMEGLQLLKSVGTLDHIKQRNDESLGDFYTRFKKELADIDQVIPGRETIRAFIRALGPRGSVLYSSLSVIPVNTVKPMMVRIKSYVELEIVKTLKRRFKGKEA